MAVLKIEVNKGTCLIEPDGNTRELGAEIATAIHGLYVMFKDKNEIEAELYRLSLTRLLNMRHFWDIKPKSNETLVEVDKPEDFWEDGWPIGGGDR